MIRFISYNKGDELNIIYQCEYIFDMLSKEVIGDTIIHKRSGRDITNTLKNWRKDVMKIKWSCEVFDNAIDTYIEPDPND